MSKGIAGGERRGTADKERFAMILVAAFLGDDIHEACIGASDLGGGPGVHDLKLAHHGLRKEEGPILRAALSALQRIGEVRAIHGNGRRLLGRWPSTISPAELGRLNAGRQLSELGEVAVAIGQVGDRQSCERIADLGSFFVYRGRQCVAFHASDRAPSP